MPYDTETDEAYDELFESDESADEMDEAAQPWKRPSPKTATGKNLYTARPQTQFVTQAQLQTALAKVGFQVSTNSRAINQVNTRVASVTMGLKRETIERKKDATALRSNLSQTQQLSAILPLLSRPKSVLETDVASSLVGQNVLVDSGSSLSLLLPMLLMSGIGDGGGTTSSGVGGGLFGGGGDGMGSMMMLALVLGLGK